MADGSERPTARTIKPLRISVDAITGAGGLSKSGSKQNASTGGATEAPDTLRSTQTASVIDLLSEGTGAALYSDPASPGSGFYSVAFDGTRVANADRTLNFAIQSYDQRYGGAGQIPLAGFPSAQSETVVNTQLRYGQPIVHSIDNTDADRVRFTVSVPSLTYTDQTSGSVAGTTAVFNFYIQNNGGGYVLQGSFGIYGKSSGKYQRAYVFALPPPGPWDIRVDRGSADSTTQYLQNDTWWDSFSTIIDDPVAYSYSCLFAWKIGADQFQAIPTRSYHMQGIYIQLPTNYDPVAGTYTGAWDGNFWLAPSSNPAWVLYDILTQRRYGLGRYLDVSRIDKWALYAIGMYCDGGVPDGRGGFERRYTFNGVLNQQQDAFTMINSLCAVFRGAAFWDGGTLTFIADRPTDTVGMFSNANVINGDFVYAGADITARHNQMLITWADQANFGDTRTAIVEDQEHISAHGIITDQIDAIGCTSEGLAVRYGKWAIYTETQEGETVTFTVGLDGAWGRPGDVIEISDVTKAGLRRGGRVMAGSTPSMIILDAPAQIIANELASISIYVPDTTAAGMHVETRSISGYSDDLIEAMVAMPFSAAPAPGTVFIHTSGTLSPTLWRIVSVKEADDFSCEISAIAHNPSKYAYIENNIALSDPHTSYFPAATVVGLKAIDYLTQISAIALQTRMLISWTSSATRFDLEVTPINGVTIRTRLETTSYDMPANEGLYTIRVTPISAIGQRGIAQQINYTVIGASAPPADVTMFRVAVQGSTGFFAWTPSPDLDVRIGGHFEMRYSTNLSADWNTSTVILPSIPGSASTVELPYRAGLYAIKAMDASGNYSRNAALIETTEIDSDYTPFVRYCENPDWLGTKVGTEMRLPQQWLVLGQTGGLWDDQLDNMDDWPDIDVLQGGDVAAGQGYYYFDQVLDIGGVFTVRLTLDMLAFQLGYEDNYIDTRLQMIDDWTDFDDVQAGQDGNVQIFMATTQDDPTSPGAVWSAWSPFVIGSYTARAFQFYAYLTASAGQNVAIETLCIIADLRNKIDTGADIAWNGVTIHVFYGVEFFLPPSLTVTLQQPRVGDHMRITNKRREGFDIDLFDSSGNPVPAGIISFDWQAIGY